MNKLVTCIGILFCCTSVWAQKKEAAITYLHYIPWNKVLKAGDKQIFIQKCVPEVDSVLYGTVFIPKSGVKSVQHCDLTLRILNDTVYTFKLITKDSKNTKALLNEVISQYGPPQNTLASATETTYNWQDTFPNTRISLSTLVISKNGKSGILTSELKQE